MSENNGLLSSGLSMALRNKRYIVWFYLLNLVLALFGTMGFVNQAGSILDHSLQSDRLVHGFDVGVLVEMFARPEFGPAIVSRLPAMCLALLFMISTALFMPGVFQGYASTYRLPRDQFFRACGRNLWRFIRLLFVAGIVFGIFTVALFSLNDFLVKKAGDSTNEVLPFTVQMIGLGVIFLIMTALRVWFDLAEADVVLNDQNAVRRSIAAGFRHMWQSLGRLVLSYVGITIFAAVVLLAGIWVWMRFVPAASVVGAMVVSQLTLLLLLIPRFWQRGVAVAYWQQKMMVPVVTMQPVAPTPISMPVVSPPAAPEAPAV